MITKAPTCTANWGARASIGNRTSECNFAAAALGAVGTDDADVVRGLAFDRGFLFHIERELVAGMRLGNVSNLESADVVVAVPFEWPQVENVFDVFHAVDMSIDIDIVVVSINSAHELSVVGHFNTTTLIDRTFCILDHPIAQMERP